MNEMATISALALESMVKHFEEETAQMREKLANKAKFLTSLNAESEHLRGEILRLRTENDWLRTELESCQHSYKVLNEHSEKQFVELRRISAKKTCECQ